MCFMFRATFTTQSSLSDVISGLLAASNEFLFGAEPGTKQQTTQRLKNSICFLFLSDFGVFFFLEVKKDSQRDRTSREKSQFVCSRRGRRSLFSSHRSIVGIRREIPEKPEIIRRVIVD